MSYLDVATSCHPFKVKSWMPPWYYFPIFTEVNIFSDSICTCGLFGTKISSRQTCLGFFYQICIVFQILSFQIVRYHYGCRISWDIPNENRKPKIENMDWERQLKQVAGTLVVLPLSLIVYHCSLSSQIFTISFTLIRASRTQPLASSRWVASFTDMNKGLAMWFLRRNLTQAPSKTNLILQITTSSLTFGALVLFIKVCTRFIWF